MIVGSLRIAVPMGAISSIASSFVHSNKPKFRDVSLKVYPEKISLRLPWVLYALATQSPSNNKRKRSDAPLHYWHNLAWAIGMISISGFAKWTRGRTSNPGFLENNIGYAELHCSGVTNRFIVFCSCRYWIELDPQISIFQRRIP